MKYFLILIITAFIFSGCTKEDQQNTKKENLPPVAPSYDFTGQGFKNAEVSLLKGNVAITYIYQGEGDFIVTLTKTDNTDTHLIANIKSSKAETVRVDIPADGKYMLNIQTQGSYTVSLREKQMGQQ